MTLRAVSAQAAAVLAASMLVACGGSDGKQGKQGKAPAAKPGAPSGAATPDAAIKQYFTARRLGKAAEGCALESEAFQTLHYEGVGQPCLDDAANKMPQAVWAEDTKIVDLKATGDSAAGTIQPNAGSDAQAQVALVRVDGRWLIDSLR